MTDDVAGVDPESKREEEQVLPDELPESQRNGWDVGDEAREQNSAAEADTPADEESASEEVGREEETSEPVNDEDRVSDKAKTKRTRPGKTQRTIGRLEGQVSALTETVNQLAGQQARPETVTESEPNRRAYAKYEDYLPALTAFNARKAVHEEVDAARRHYAASAKQRQQVEQTRTLFADGMKTHADFAEVVDPSLEISRGMVEAMFGTEHPTDVVYHLGTHREETARISRLPPLTAAAEIGRISATLAATGTPGGSRINSADPSSQEPTELPDPPNTIHGGGAPTKDPGRMSIVEYRAWRMRGGQT